MQNNIFQFNRFNKLILRGLTFQTKSKLYFLLGFAGLPVFMLLMNIITGAESFDLDSRQKFLQTITAVIFLFAPFIFFSHINHPKKGFIDVMLPASVFEKFLYMQLASIIILPLFAYVVYGGVDLIISFASSQYYKGSVLSGTIDNFLTNNWESYVTLFCFQQAIFFFNLYFVNHKLIKSIGTIIIILISIMFLFIIFFKLLFPMTFENGDINITFPGNGSLFITKFDTAIEIFTKLVRMFFAFVVPVGLVIGSYFRMKTIRY